jgi:hypothetical protein
MTTDTAVGVSKRVVEDKGEYRDFQDAKTKLMDSTHRQNPIRCMFLAMLSRPDADIQDFPTITFNKYESIEMPFRMSQVLGGLARADNLGYITDEKNQPILPPGMKEHLKADLNRTIDDF